MPKALDLALPLELQGAFVGVVGHELEDVGPSAEVERDHGLATIERSWIVPWMFWSMLMPATAAACLTRRTNSICFLSFSEPSGSRSSRARLSPRPSGSSRARVPPRAQR